MFTDNVRRDKAGLQQLLTDIFPLAMVTHPALVIQDVVHRRWAFDRAVNKQHLDVFWALKDIKSVFGRLLYVLMQPSAALAGAGGGAVGE